MQEENPKTPSASVTTSLPLNQSPNQQPGDFSTVDLGTLYELPIFHVTEGVGIEYSGFSYHLPFVRGSKLPGGEEVEKRSGVTHESLLEMMIADLEYKNSLVPSREGSLAITKLEEARLWMQRRQDKRKKAGTQGTYQK